MDPIIFQIAGSLGVGGFLGTLIFVMHLKDKKASEGIQRTDRKFMEDRLTGLLKDDHVSREANTKILTELTILIERLNGKLSK